MWSGERVWVLSPVESPIPRGSCGAGELGSEASPVLVGAAGRGVCGGVKTGNLRGWGVGRPGQELPSCGVCIGGSGVVRGPSVERLEGDRGLEFMGP